MYRVITYRSRPLKVSTFPIDDITATDEPVADFDEEINSKKKKKKKKTKDIPDEQTYIIDGVEVSEEDLTFDERLDMEANALLNSDGFYSPLQPLDYYDNESDGKPVKSNKFAIIGIIMVMVMIAVGVGVAMFLLK